MLLCLHVLLCCAGSDSVLALKQKYESCAKALKLENDAYVNKNDAYGESEHEG